MSLLKLHNLLLLIKATRVACLFCVLPSDDLNRLFSPASVLVIRRMLPTPANHPHPRSGNRLIVVGLRDLGLIYPSPWNSDTWGS
jgi:hypothetical protein